MLRLGGMTQEVEFDQSGVPVETYKGITLRSAYQPIYSITGLTRAQVIGFEGLVRPSLNGSEIDPAKFLESIVAEDRVFVESMCMALHVRSYALCKSKNKKLFLNINVANYPSVEVVECEIFYMFSQLSKHGLSKDKVVFEIHNTAVVAPYVLVRICELFRSNGFKFALDDFGVGHSNIERYLMLRPDIIKINRSLFVDSNRLKKVETLLASLIAGFRENGAQVLMEGLETEEELISATEMDISMVQGFHLSKPLSAPFEVDEDFKINRQVKLPNLSVVAQ